MFAIQSETDSCGCQFRAHVWFRNHSHQWGCFTTDEGAREWAQWLHRKIVTEDLFKVKHGQKRE